MIFFPQTYSIRTLDLLKKLSHPTSRAALQTLQSDFDENADRPYFLFFQRFLGEYKNYAWPKRLSTTHRNTHVFKVSKLHYCLKLRFIAFKCQNCSHYFTSFNSTKPVCEWEDGKLPQISKNLLQNEGIFFARTVFI